MRISDWSSDVCSSDLRHSGRPIVPVTALPLLPALEVKEMIEAMLPVDGHAYAGVTVSKALIAKTLAGVSSGHARALEHLLSVVREIGRASCRERLCQYV